MRYILKYKDKEDFLEENPKEEIGFPIIWKYPTEAAEEYSYGDIEYDQTTGEVTNYEEPTLHEDDCRYVVNYREDGSNDMLALTIPGKAIGYLENFVPWLNIVTILDGDFGLALMKHQAPFTPGGIYVAQYPENWTSNQFQTTEAVYGANFYMENSWGTFPDLWANKGSGLTVITQNFGTLSGQGVSEYGFSGGTNGFYPTEVDKWKNFVELYDEDDNEWGSMYVAPTGTPVSAYARTARIVNLVDDEATSIPAAFIEPNENGFLVTSFMFGPDLSSCGFTATKGDWFGLCISGTVQEPQISFKNFYTEGETGMVETTHYQYNGTPTAKTRQYFTIFYLEGDNENPGEVVSLSSNPNILGANAINVRTPYFALTRQHFYRSYTSSEEIEDHAFDGVYDLFSYTISTSTTYEKGQKLSGYFGTITVVNGEAVKKDSVTKVEPGFAHVLNPDSVYYNDLSKDSGDEPSDFVIPGASTDAPGSKINLNGSGSGGGQQE